MRRLIIVCLCLWGLLGTLAAEKASAESYAVSIANVQFSPGSLSIKAGDTVVWTNTDDRDHTVIAQDGSFTSGTIRRGETFSFKFDKSGRFAYGCKFHPRMKGTVVVAPSK